MEVDQNLLADAKKAASQLARYGAYLTRLKNNLKAHKKASTQGHEKEDDEDEFIKIDEDLIKAPIAEIEEKNDVLKVTDKQKMHFFGRTKGGFHSTYDEVTRVDLRFIITKFRLRVETISDMHSKKSVRADVSTFGPKDSKITWSALSIIIRLACEYGIPIERIATMLGQFSGKQIFNWLYKQAEKLILIYFVLFEQLAEARYLALDDSPTKVIEIRKKLEKNQYGNDREDKDKLDPIVARSAEVFGRAFDKADGSGKKNQVNVTVVHGRVDQCDPRSYIVLYRSHNGSAGNLLSSLLSMRRRSNKKLTVQGDLSGQNRPNALYYHLFDIDNVGCGAHARRDIWRYKDRDDELCGFLLRAFAMLSYVEKLIDIKGRTRRNILHYRRRYSQWIWKIIYKRAFSVIKAKRVKDCKGHKFWPNDYELHKACKYIVSNYKKLTAYIFDPHLSWTNNLSERLLRSEKMLLIACKFRLSERGRVVFDILRTILMTCRAARISFTGYLKWVNKFPDEEIEAAPENFTPAAYYYTENNQNVSAKKRAVLP
jgi:hypothetical protein